MLDFAAYRAKTVTYNDLVAGLGIDDLRALTNEMVDTMLDLIAGCTDADVTFQPIDLDADDPYAEAADEATMAWTLGHVIVHATASSEESAFLAAELARGVVPASRSRYEVPWVTVTTIAQCRARLEESRRMRLATLDVWPDAPHFDLTYKPWPTSVDINCVGRFVLGLKHDWDHLGQIKEIVRQAQALPMAAD